MLQETETKEAIGFAVMVFVISGISIEGGPSSLKLYGRGNALTASLYYTVYISQKNHQKHGRVYCI